MNTKISTQFTVEHNGKTVHVEISPCSWMHKGYGLQIGLSLKDKACNAETIFSLDRSIDACDMSVDAMLVHAEQSAKKWLSENGVGPLAKKIDDWATESAKWQKEIDRENAKRAARAATMNAKRKAEGYTHKITAVIHPKNGGDDYMIEAYVKGAPTETDIAGLLKKSAVKNDYRVDVL